MPKRRCDYCTPHPANAPSGIVWLHSQSCSKYSKQKVGEEKLIRPAEHEARTLHPAGTDLNVNFSFSKGFEGWHRQPKVGPMTEAVAYVDAHVDDELEEAES